MRFNLRAGKIPAPPELEARVPFFHEFIVFVNRPLDVRRAVLERRRVIAVVEAEVRLYRR